MKTVETFSQLGRISVVNQQAEEWDLCALHCHSSPQEWRTTDCTHMQIA